MSTNLRTDFLTSSSRLIEERKRLGLSQNDCRLHAGVARQTWIDYEAGRTFPNVPALQGLDRVGFDVYYIVTGEHAGGQLTSEESLLLETLREMDSRTRAMVMGTVLGWTHPDRILPWLSGGSDRPDAGNESAHNTPLIYNTNHNPRRETLQESKRKSGKTD